MSLREDKNGNAMNPASDWIADPALGAELDQALARFRQNVHAWSEAAYSRPRSVAPVAVHRSWRMATGWALGCVLAAGSLAGGVYEHHRQAIAKAIAKMNADQDARQRQLAVQQRAGNADEDLLATVDSDVSRAVPAAMEPLAQLMDGDEDQ